MTSTAAQQLAEAVVIDGSGPHRAALAVLFAEARRLGVPRILVDIASDPSEPRCARERALGRVVVQYSRLVEEEGERALDRHPVGAFTAA